MLQGSVFVFFAFLDRQNFFKKDNYQASESSTDRLSLVSAFLSREFVSIMGMVLFFWVIGGLIFNLYRWRWIIGSYKSKRPSLRLALKALMGIIKRDMLIQKEMFACSPMRGLSHFAVFWGFNLLVASAILNYFPTYLQLIRHPGNKIIGNVGGFLFIAGLTPMIYRRVFRKIGRRSSTFGDILFLLLLYMVGLSGFAMDVLSDLGSSELISMAYVAHILSIMVTFILAPFTKFIHAFGRLLLSFSENYQEAE